MNPLKVQRKHLIEQYGKLYKRHRIGEEEQCFYCGARRETLDHRPPISLLQNYPPPLLRRLRIPMVLIACCRDCNGRLGAKKLATADEAIVHLYRLLTAAYERDFALWSESEIREMSKMFQTMIRARKRKLEYLQERINHMERRMFDKDSMPRFQEAEDDEENDE